MGTRMTPTLEHGRCCQTLHAAWWHCTLPEQVQTGFAAPSAALASQARTQTWRVKAHNVLLAQQKR